MTRRPRFVMAAFMLRRVWRSEDPESRIPTDDEMTSFAAAVGLGCADSDIGGALGPTEVAAYLYATTDDFRR